MHRVKFRYGVGGEIERLIIGTLAYREMWGRAHARRLLLGVVNFLIVKVAENRQTSMKPWRLWHRCWHLISLCWEYFKSSLTTIRTIRHQRRDSLLLKVSLIALCPNSIPHLFPAPLPFFSLSRVITVRKTESGKGLISWQLFSILIDARNI